MKTKYLIFILSLIFIQSAVLPKDKLQLSYYRSRIVTFQKELSKVQEPDFEFPHPLLRGSNPKQPRKMTSDVDEELNEEKYQQFIEKLKSRSYKQVVFLTGAGASTSAGIPDFRSENGLFAQLQEKYHLATPEDFFDIERFVNRPEYFYDYCKEFKPEKYSPTLFHYFMGFISTKIKLKYLFTQNIDGLDLRCGVDESKIVFAHGNFNSIHCPGCEKEFPKKLFDEYVDKGEVLYCDRCGGPVKPRITFYGEPLPYSFYQKGNKIDEADLVILCGTSLLVAPFNQLVDKANRKATRVIINREPYPRIYSIRGFDFDSEESNDIFLKGDCDEAVKRIIKDTDWNQDFNMFIEKTKKEEEIKKKNVKTETK